MEGDVDLAAIAALLADPSRATILLELLGGEPIPAGELARRAGLSPSGASNHLRKLLAAGLIEVLALGRTRRYRLAAPEVAAALEALGRIAPRSRTRTLHAMNRRHALERARSCYDHLAGSLGVKLTDHLIRQRLLKRNDGGYAVTRRGERWFIETLSIDTDGLRASPRQLALACPDLTEGRPHLAGALGAALAHAFVERDLVRRDARSRALRITDSGSNYLAALGIEL